MLDFFFVGGLTSKGVVAWHLHYYDNYASLRFIKRNVKTNSIKTKELAYKTYVRPKVEYCSVVWDPWQKQQINKMK
jgi:hypothetical protein